LIFEIFVVNLTKAEIEVLAVAHWYVLRGAQNLLWSMLLVQEMVTKRKIFACP